MLAEFANALAVAYQFFAVMYIAWERQLGKTVHPAWAGGFAIALVYASFYNLWLKGRLRGRKWETEERRRAEALAVAVSRLAACERRAAFGPVDLDDVEHGLLTAMLSEVEAVVADTEGIYLNVTLLIEHPQDATKLICLNRANRTRERLKTYPRDDMLGWQAMVEGRVRYRPHFESPEPYRAILALPIRYSDDQAVVTSLGAVSIDSERANDFDGLELKVERKLLAYVALLKLVLIYRRKHNVWPWMRPQDTALPRRPGEHPPAPA